MDTNQKKVDESWKDNIDKERVPDNAPAQEEQFSIPEANFSFFITTLGMQASIALGDMPNPADNKPEQNLDQAKFLIDTLAVIEDKTKNNLTKEEEALLKNFLHELRMRYVEKKEGRKQ